MKLPIVVVGNPQALHYNSNPPNWYEYQCIWIEILIWFVALLYYGYNTWPKILIMGLYPPSSLNKLLQTYSLTSQEWFISKDLGENLSFKQWLVIVSNLDNTTTILVLSSVRIYYVQDGRWDGHNLIGIILALKYIKCQTSKYKCTFRQIQDTGKEGMWKRYQNIGTQ